MGMSPGRRTGREIMCQQYVELVTDHLEAALDPPTRAHVERHLGVCEPCRGYLAQIEHLLDLIRHPPTGPVSAAMLDAVAAEFARRNSRRPA